MVFRMQPFAGDVGPERLNRFAKSRIGQTLSEDLMELSGLKFGRAADAWYHALPAEARRKLMPDLQRVENLTSPLAQDCLKQVLEDPDVRSRFFKDHKGARQRALFCLLERPNAFLAAEARFAQGNYRFNGRYFDSYDSAENLRPGPIPKSGTFIREIRPTVHGAFDPNTKFRVEQTSIWPRYPVNAGEVFQTVIVAGEDTMIARYNKSGTDPVLLPIERMAVISYWPKTGRILVSGMRYKREGRKALVTAYAKHVLGLTDAPTATEPDTFLLAALALRTDLRPPARSGIADISFTSAAFTRDGATRSASQNFLPARNLVSAFLAQNDSLASNGSFRKTRWHSLTLAISMLPSADYPDGRVIEAKLQPHLVSVKSKLDDDLAVIMSLVDLWHLRANEHVMPLFREVA